MAATWADYGGAPLLCWRGWTDLSHTVHKVQYTRYRYSKSPTRRDFLLENDEIFHFRQIFRWKTYRRHARLVGSCWYDVVGKFLRKMKRQLPITIPGKLPWNLRMILSQLAKKSLLESTKNLEFQVGSNGRQGVMSPQKRDCQVTYSKMFKGWWKTWRWGNYQSI